jgi:hypothetical protein
MAVREAHHQVKKVTVIDRHVLVALAVKASC